jgi:periplasmic divalent cation tolerance protein
MPFILLYVTHPSKPEAMQISTELLKKRYIACVNYLPIESTYWWDEEIQTGTEILTIYKTRKENYEAVKNFIELSHVYDTPCIIRLAEVTANE